MGWVGMGWNRVRRYGSYLQEQDVSRGWKRGRVDWRQVASSCVVDGFSDTGSDTGTVSYWLAGI